MTDVFNKTPNEKWPSNLKFKSEQKRLLKHFLPPIPHGIIGWYRQRFILLDHRLN